MALAYRSGSFVSAGNASGGDLTINKPTGTADGDIVVILCYFEPDTCAISINTSGWEALEVANTGAFKIRGFWKKASSEPASYTLSNDVAGNQWRTAVAVAYSGGTGSGTLLDSGASSTAQADAHAQDFQTTPSVTTNGADRMVAFFYSNFSGTDPASTTGFCTNLRGTLGGTLISDAVKTAAGATGTSNGNASGSQDYAAMHVALISDLAGGTTVTPGMVTITESLPTPTVTGSTQSATITPPMFAVTDSLMTASPAVTIVSCGTPAFTATNGATLAPTLPTGWAADDIHILLAARSDNTAMTDPGNRWANLGTLTANNTTAQRIEVWWRRAQAGDTAPTLTFGSSTVARGAIIIGVHGGTPNNSGPFVGQTLSSNAAAATVTFATITPSEPNTVLLALYAYEDDPSAASTITGWQPFKVFADASGNDMTLGYAHRIYEPDDTATGALSTTVSGGTFANSVNEGALIAIERTIFPPTLTPAMFTEAVSLQTPSIATVQTVLVSPAMLTETAALTTPTILPSQSALLTPAMLTLSEALTVPVVAGQQSVLATPAMLTETLTLLDPTISAPNSVTVTPGLLTITISTPTLASTDHKVLPDDFAITESLTTSVVTAVASPLIQPAMQTIEESVSAATISAQRSVSLSPAMLTLTESLPAASTNAVAGPAMLVESYTLTTATISGHQGVTVTPAMLTLTEALIGPTVVAGGSVSVSADDVTLTETLLAPAVATQRSVVMTPAMLTETLSTPAAASSGIQNVAVAPALLTVSVTVTDASTSAQQNPVITPATLALQVSVLAASMAGQQNAAILPGLLAVQMLVLAASGHGPPTAPDIDGPTQVTLASTGQRRAILATTGLMLAVLASTGARLAATTETGIRQSTLSSTGERDADTTNSGEQEADTNSGVTSATLLH